MIDREKVIRAVETCFDSWIDKHRDMGYDLQVVKQMKHDALELLKEQEPVTMKPYYFNYICSGCRSEIDGEFIDYTGGKIKFCPYCGKAVKWDE